MKTKLIQIEPDLPVGILKAKEARFSWWFKLCLGERPPEGRPLMAVDYKSYLGGGRYPEYAWEDFDYPIRDYGPKRGLQLLFEHAVLISLQTGEDLDAVLRQFCQVEEFWAMGEGSYPMRGILSRAVYGSGWSSDWPPGSGENV